jgi:hypothetical protein
MTISMSTTYPYNMPRLQTSYKPILMRVSLKLEIWALWTIFPASVTWDRSGVTFIWDELITLRLQPSVVINTVCTYVYK